jgi:hypothetical protein
MILEQPTFSNLNRFRTGLTFQQLLQFQHFQQYQRRSYGHSRRNTITYVPSPLSSLADSDLSLPPAPRQLTQSVSAPLVSVDDSDVTPKKKPSVVESPKREVANTSLTAKSLDYLQFSEYAYSRWPLYGAIEDIFITQFAQQSKVKTLLAELVGSNARRAQSEMLRLYRQQRQERGLPLLPDIDPVVLVERIKEVRDVPSTYLCETLYNPPFYSGERNVVVHDFQAQAGFRGDHQDEGTKSYFGSIINDPNRRDSEIGTDGEIIIAFRGSRSGSAIAAVRATFGFESVNADWHEDMKSARKFKYVEELDMRIGEGFWKIFQSCSKEIGQQIATQYKSGNGIVFTGHSLGAALASVSYMALKKGFFDAILREEITKNLKGKVAETDLENAVEKEIEHIKSTAKCYAYSAPKITTTPPDEYDPNFHVITYATDLVSQGELAKPLDSLRGRGPKEIRGPHVKLAPIHSFPDSHEPRNVRDQLQGMSGAEVEFRWTSYKMDTELNKVDHPVSGYKTPFTANEAALYLTQYRIEGVVENAMMWCEAKAPGGALIDLIKVKAPILQGFRDSKTPYTKKSFGLLQEEFEVIKGELEKIIRKNEGIIATNEAKLNEDSPDYESTLEGRAAAQLAIERASNENFMAVHLLNNVKRGIKATKLTNFEALNTVKKDPRHAVDLEIPRDIQDASPEVSIANGKKIDDLLSGDHNILNPMKASLQKITAAREEISYLIKPWVSVARANKEQAILKPIQDGLTNFITEFETLKREIANSKHAGYAEETYNHLVERMNEMRIIMSQELKKADEAIKEKLEEINTELGHLPRSVSLDELSEEQQDLIRQRAVFREARDTLRETARELRTVYRSSPEVEVLNKRHTIYKLTNMAPLTDEGQSDHIINAISCLQENPTNIKGAKDAINEALARSRVSLEALQEKSQSWNPLNILSSVMDRYYYGAQERYTQEVSRLEGVIEELDALNKKILSKGVKKLVSSLELSSHSVSHSDSLDLTSSLLFESPYIKKHGGLHKQVEMTDDLALAQKLQEQYDHEYISYLEDKSGLKKSFKFTEGEKTDLKAIGNTAWLTAPHLDKFVQSVTNSPFGNNDYILNGRVAMMPSASITADSTVLSHRLEQMRAVANVDKIVMPIGDNVHWRLLSIDKAHGTVTIHDSLADTSLTQAQKLIIENRVMTAVRQKFPNTVWNFAFQFHNEQTNGYSCGDYSLKRLLTEAGVVHTLRDQGNAADMRRVIKDTPELQQQVEVVQHQSPTNL